MAFSRRWLILFSFAFFLGCGGKVSVQLPAYQSGNAGSVGNVGSGLSALAALAPREIQLAPVEDARPPYLPGGTRQAAFGVPMGNVEFKQDVTAVVKEMLVSELRAAGLSVKDVALSSDTKDAKALKAKVLLFNVRTDATALYWDVIGDVRIVLATPGAPTGLEYSSRQTERTYVWPGEELIRTVMGKCTQDLGRQIRNDPRLVDALK